MVLVVVHVDIVLRKLVPLIARHALTHLTIKHRQTMVHTLRLVVLLIKAALSAPFHVLELLREFDHNR